MPWQRPRGVANGAHRKSGVIFRLTSACPVESFLPRSAYFLHTPLRDEMQALRGTNFEWLRRPHGTRRSERESLCPATGNVVPCREYFRNHACRIVHQDGNNGETLSTTCFSMGWSTGCGARPPVQLGLTRPMNEFEKNFAKPLTNRWGGSSISNCSARQMLYRVVAVGTPSKVSEKRRRQPTFPKMGTPITSGPLAL
jgi:hypothetical protein